MGQPLRLFYNRARGPLRQTGRLQWKAGFNKWEEILMVEMKKTDLPVGAWGWLGGKGCCATGGGAP